MKKFLTTTALLSTMAAGTAAQAQTGSWYGSLFGGLSFGATIDASVEGYPVDLSFEFDPGYVIGAAVGTYVSPTTRVEAEVSYAAYEGGTYTVNYAGGSYSYSLDNVEGSATYVLGNVWFDVPTAAMAGGAPYVGGGLGMAKFDDGFEESDFALAYQIGAGVRVPMGAGAFDVGYRYKATGELDFGDTEPVTFDSSSSSNLQVGFVTNF